MFFSLSTRWNASRHTSGEAMIEDILGLGVSHVELGYDLSVVLVPGVRRMVNEKAVSVDSVHAFCPVPIGAPYGHPELFTLCSRDRRVRAAAVSHLTRTLEFTGEVGAGVVVLHAGNVKMRNMTHRLAALCQAGKQSSTRYEKIKDKLM
jgi:sugar phosphate isomerase/epimerase